MTSVADDGTSSECKGEWLVNRLWNVRATNLDLVKGSYHCEGALVYDGEWRDPFDRSREIERVEAAHAQQMQQQMQQQLEQCALMAIHDTSESKDPKLPTKAHRIVVAKRPQRAHR
jgi:hypothetical protein